MQNKDKEIIGGGEKPNLPHGHICGVPPCGIISYNNNTDDIPEAELPSYDHINYVHDSRGRLHFSGFKWQCVEYARRWWIAQLDVYLPSIGRACEIWTVLKTVKDLSDKSGAYVALVKHESGSTTVRPEIHDAIIWKSTESAFVGHIAVVCEVTDSMVRVAEQNVDNNVLWKGGHYAREFKLTQSGEGIWTMHDDEDPIHGWVRVDKSGAKAPLKWEFPTANQVEVTGIFDDATQSAYCRFVGQEIPIDIPAERWAMFKNFFFRIVDLGMVAFVNSKLEPFLEPLISLPWFGFSANSESYDRTPLIKKLQLFINEYPEITNVEVAVTGKFDESTIRGVQNLLNKVHYADDFQSAVVACRAKNSL